MRRFILIRFAVLIAFAFTMAGWQIVDSENLHAGSENDKMPYFLYYTLEGEKYTQKQLKKDSRYMFVYFNPHCHICHNEAREIVENLELLENVQVVMVSPSSADEIASFVEEYQLDQYDDIVVLHDQEDLFYKDFGATGYPNVFLFDEKKEMLMFYDMGVYVEQVMEVYEQKVYSRKKGDEKAYY